MRRMLLAAALLLGSDTGQEVLRVLVARVRFAGGDEYNRPERGRFLDVPARHGEVVLKQSYGGGKIAT